VDVRAVEHVLDGGLGTAGDEDFDAERELLQGVEKNRNEIASFPSILFVAFVEGVENDEKGKRERSCTASECIRKKSLGLQCHLTFADVAVSGYRVTYGVIEHPMPVRKLAGDGGNHGCGPPTFRRATRSREEEGRCEALLIRSHVRDTLGNRRLASTGDASQPVHELGRRVRHPRRYLVEELGPSALQTGRCRSMGIMKSGLDWLETIKESYRQTSAVAHSKINHQRHTLFFLTGLTPLRCRLSALT
jgi:hypothetical protein